MEFSVSQPPSYKQFIANMDEKMADPFFVEDMQSLIRPETPFDIATAYDLVREKLIDLLKK